MSALVLAPRVQRMSTREIAALTNKHHRHVLRDARKMLADLGEDEKGYTQTWADPQNGQTYEELLLDRELTDTLLLGYDVVARRAVVRRWHQLEIQEQERRIAERDKKQTRLEGKVARAGLADCIARFIEYAHDQGSSNADWYYSSITTMEYKALGLVKQSGDKHFRDRLDALSNTKLAVVEMTCQHGLRDGMTQGLHYKEIFKLAQSRVITLVSALDVGLPRPVAPILIEQTTHPPPRKRHPAKGEAPTLGPVEASMKNPTSDQTEGDFT